MTLLSYICYFGLVASGISVSAKEMQVDAAKSQSPYRSGKKHQEIMDMKKKSWETARARGGFRQDSHPKLTFTECIDGRAQAIRHDEAHIFRCSNADLHHSSAMANLVLLRLVCR